MPDINHEDSSQKFRYSLGESYQVTFKNGFIPLERLKYVAYEPLIDVCENLGSHFLLIILESFISYR